jgi:3D-(3,5/4)-trihydroxycyclohexane-1,2-dione acylhydrolase (decyclizing)
MMHLNLFLDILIALQDPEQILSSLPQAIQVMLDPADCGPATISMSQDVQGEIYDYPEVFFEEKIHTIRKFILIQIK